MVVAEEKRWRWENAAAGAIAGFTTVASLHPLDVIRTRFQVSDGRGSSVPQYNNTAHAIFSIARYEGVRGLYAGFYPAVFGSTVSWGLYFFFYNRAKQRYSSRRDDQLSPAYHLVSAAEAGALFYRARTRLWEKLPLLKGVLVYQSNLAGKDKTTTSGASKPLQAIFWILRSDAMRTILKEEGWLALYRGLGPSLFLVTHGAIQFTVYEELKRAVIHVKRREIKSNSLGGEELLSSFDYATLGAASKVAAMLFTYPYQVIRTRLQQRPSTDGVPKYLHSWHVVKETTRFEGFRGFYKGITSNLLKNIPAASITFVVYENVLKLIQLTRDGN
ncbi:folate transporter 1 isoform X1 [Carex rostrata]